MTDNPLAAAFLRRLAERDDEPAISPFAEAAALRDQHAAFLRRYAFAPGDLVRQKGGLAVFKNAGPNGFYVVVEVLAAPYHAVDHVSEPSDFGSYFTTMVYDLIVGERHEGGAAFALFYVDSRFFEPVPAAEVA
jgi:hypothetical protein